MKYYFVSYSYTKGGKMSIANALIDEHPLSWQKRVKEEFEDEETLISWQEISEEDYKEYNGWIG